MCESWLQRIQGRVQEWRQQYPFVLLWGAAASAHLVHDVCQTPIHERAMFDVSQIAPCLNPSAHSECARAKAIVQLVQKRLRLDRTLATRCYVLWGIDAHAPCTLELLAQQWRLRPPPINNCPTVLVVHDVHEHIGMHLFCKIMMRPPTHDDPRKVPMRTLHIEPPNDSMRAALLEMHYLHRRWEYGMQLFHDSMAQTLVPRHRHSMWASAVRRATATCGPQALSAWWQKQQNSTLTTADPWCLVMPSDVARHLKGMCDLDHVFAAHVHDYRDMCIQLHARLNQLFEFAAPVAKAYTVSTRCAKHLCWGQAAPRAELKQHVHYHACTQFSLAAAVEDALCSNGVAVASHSASTVGRAMHYFRHGAMVMADAQVTVHCLKRADTALAHVPDIEHVPALGDRLETALELQSYAWRDDTEVCGEIASMLTIGGIKQSLGEKGAIALLTAHVEPTSTVHFADPNQQQYEQSNRVMEATCARARQRFQQQLVDQQQGEKTAKHACCPVAPERQRRTKLVHDVLAALGSHVYCYPALNAYWRSTNAAIACGLCEVCISLDVCYVGVVFYYAVLFPRCGQGRDAPEYNALCRAMDEVMTCCIMQPITQRQQRGKHHTEFENDMLLATLLKQAYASVGPCAPRESYTSVTFTDASEKKLHRLWKTVLKSVFRFE